MILLILISLLPLLNLLTPGLPVTHDGQDHVARIANFYTSLTDGNLIPRWAANLNWGYGHPILMFLYPLPSYLTSVFHAIGFSLIDSTKLVFVTSYVGSILAMYLWLREKWGKEAGIAGAILYGFAPYRFVDLYVRGAIGEHVAFIFPPLILLGLDRQSLLLTSLATAGLILSHNAVSLMFLPIIVLYILYNRKAIIRNISFLLVGFAMSAFFWIPAFFEGKYTLRDIVTKGEFSDRFVPWRWFLYSPWNYGGGAEFSKQLGIAQWVSIILSIVFRNKLTFLVFLTLFLMTQESKFIWDNVSILQKFQFPWRFLSLTTFLTATIGAITAPQLPKRYVWVIGFLAIVSTFSMWHAKAYQTQPESFYTSVYEGTTDTGESSPIWSVRFMEKRQTNVVEVIEGEAKIEVIGRKTTKHEYQIEASKRSRIVDNTLYFPGWKVFVDGKPVEIEFQDPAWRGLMTFWVEPGVHQVDIAFGETKLRKFADIISLMGIVLLVLIYAKTHFRSVAV